MNNKKYKEIVDKHTPKENVIKNKNEAIRLLNNYLDTCISTDNKHLKKANLISYWLKDYIRYIANITRCKYE